MYKLEIERLDDGTVFVQGTKKVNESTFSIALAMATDIRSLAEKEKPKQEGARIALSVISQMLPLIDDHLLPYINLVELKKSTNDVRSAVN